MVSLSQRVHGYARPAARERLIAFFTRILGAKASWVLAEPIVVFRFLDNSSYSVEFTDSALDEQQARLGAWLELRTDDAAGLERKVVAAGLPRVHYVTGRFYFQAPGGQVWGIVAG